MNYKYIKTISYAIGTRENKVTKEEVIRMRKRHKKLKRKEVSAIAR